MGETLTEQCRVNDDDLRIVKFCCRGRMVGRVESYLFDGTLLESPG